MRAAHVRPKAICIPFDGVLARTDRAMRTGINAACDSCRLALNPTHLPFGLPIAALLRTLAHEQRSVLLPSEIDRAEREFASVYTAAIRSEGATLLDANILALVAALRAQIQKVEVALVSTHLRDLVAIASDILLGTRFDTIVPAPPRKQADGKHYSAREQNVFARAVDTIGWLAMDFLGIARTPHDVASMRKVGMCAVGLRTDVRSSELLGTAGAWRVFISPKTLSVFGLIDVFRTGPPTIRARDRKRPHVSIEETDG